MQSIYTKRFVVLAAQREAAYWTPITITRELRSRDMLDVDSYAELVIFRDAILKDLVGRAAERFWASDAVTPSRAASIRSACRALHDLTIETLEEATTSTTPVLP